jgi:hypothetical protein
VTSAKAVPFILKLKWVAKIILIDDIPFEIYHEDYYFTGFTY